MFLIFSCPKWAYPTKTLGGVQPSKASGESGSGSARATSRTGDAQAFGSRVSVGNDPAVELTGIEPETLGSLEDEDPAYFQGLNLLLVSWKGISYVF